MHAPIGLVACVALLLAAAGTALGAQSEAVRHAIRTETRLDLDRSAGHIARRGDETDDVTLDAPDASDDYDDDPVDPYDKNFCFDPKYRKRTLKLIKEMPFIGLFTDLKNITRFEASGHVFAKGHSYTVFDNLRTIGKVDMHFNFLNDNNVLMTEEGEPEAESQFEGLAYCASTDTFIVVRETHVHEKTQRLIGQTEEIKFNDKTETFKVIQTCHIDFEFEDENKGFEGIFYFEQDHKRFFMGLCESNYCQTVQGDSPPGLDRGHGRIVLAEQVVTNGECTWRTVKVIEVPRQAKFLDYSAMSFLGYMGSTVAITSQEDAAVWVGEFDWEALEFVGRGRVLHFPRNEHCDKVYCNVEGIQWIDAQRVVLTSDKAKSIQPHSCILHDQSIHIMALPNY